MAVQNTNKTQKAGTKRKNGGIKIGLFKDLVSRKQVTGPVAKGKKSQQARSWEKRGYKIGDNSKHRGAW